MRSSYFFLLTSNLRLLFMSFLLFFSSPLNVALAELLTTENLRHLLAELIIDVTNCIIVSIRRESSYRDVLYAPCAIRSNEIYPNRTEVH